MLKTPAFRTCALVNEHPAVREDRFNLPTFTMPKPNEQFHALSDAHQASLRRTGKYFVVAPDGSCEWPMDPRRSRADWGVQGVGPPREGPPEADRPERIEQGDGRQVWRLAPLA